MCMVTMHPDQTVFLLQSQLAPANVTDSMILRLLSKVSHPCTLLASISMLLKLKSRNAVKPNASHAQLLSLTTCRNLLKLLEVDIVTLDSLSSLKPATGAPALTVCPLAAASASFAAPNVRLPAMLPSGLYSDTQLRARYGHKIDFAADKLLKLEPLQSQLLAFHDWMTQPINLARGKQKYVTESSWQKGFLDIICMYLGFCHRFRAVNQPCLEHFLDGHHLTAFADFLMQRVSCLALHVCQYLTLLQICEKSCHCHAVLPFLPTHFSACVHPELQFCICFVGMSGAHDHHVSSLTWLVACSAS